MKDDVMDTALIVTSGNQAASLMTPDPGSENNRVGVFRKIRTLGKNRFECWQLYAVRNLADLCHEIAFCN